MEKQNEWRSPGGEIALALHWARELGRGSEFSHGAGMVRGFALGLYAAEKIDGWERMYISNIVHARRMGISA